MIADLVNGVDPHRTNAIELMELPGSDEDRQNAKTFNFRMIYFGSAYAFYMDSRMPNFSLKKWGRIVDGFYAKYGGLNDWWHRNFATVEQTGRLINPTGRILTFDRQAKWDGSLEYNKSTIANYPVQSLSADIIQLASVVASNRLRKISPEILFVMQVHDSIILDCPTKYVDKAAHICYNIFIELPSLIEQFFGFKFNVPLTGEVGYGPSWSNLTKIKESALR